MHACMYVYIYVCVYIYMCVCVCVFVYIYIYMNTNICIDTRVNPNPPPLFRCTLRAGDWETGWVTKSWLQEVVSRITGPCTPRSGSYNVSNTVLQLYMYAYMRICMYTCIYIICRCAYIAYTESWLQELDYWITGPCTAQSGVYNVLITVLS